MFVGITEIYYECGKIEHYVMGVLKNFLNKKGKNKVNYKRFIFIKKKKKNSDQFSQVRMSRLRMKLLCN